MNSALSKFDSAAARIIEIAAGLDQRNFNHVSAEALGEALTAIACHLGSTVLLRDYAPRVRPESHNLAIQLLNEDEAAFYVAGVVPPPLSAVYLLLQGFKLWTAVGHNETEISRLKNFGLAYIMLGLEIHLENQRAGLLESLARTALETDIALREGLPEIERELSRPR